jgi:Zn-dependent peptidase ImmA (M78 family)
MVATAAQVGARVRAERERMGLSQRALGRRANLPQARIHRIETDSSRSIDLVDLSKLAAGLGMTMSSLIEDSPVRDRVLAAARAGDDSAVADALRVACDLIELEERLSGLGVDDQQQLRLPKLVPSGDPRNDGRQLAQAVRSQWGLPDAPLGDLVELVEELTGADVAVRELPSDVSGLTVTEQTVGIAVVLVNAKNSPERQRFTLAHELAHLLTGDSQIDTISTPESSDAERYANSFAGHLLMPENGVKAWLTAAGSPPAATERTAATLARVFGVSLEVALIQLSTFGLITSADKQALQGRSMRALGLRYGWLRAWEAEVIAASTPRPPSRLWQRALLAYQRGLLGVGVLSRLTSVDSSELQASLDEAGIEIEPPTSVTVDIDALLARAK